MANNIVILVVNDSAYVVDVVNKKYSHAPILKGIAELDTFQAIIEGEYKHEEVKL